MKYDELELSLIRGASRGKKLIFEGCEDKTFSTWIKTYHEGEYFESNEDEEKFDIFANDNFPNIREQLNFNKILVLGYENMKGNTIYNASLYHWLLDRNGIEQLSSKPIISKSDYYILDALQEMEKSISKRDVMTLERVRKG